MPARSWGVTDFLARVNARIQGNKLPLAVLPVQLDPYVPTAADITRAAIAAAPGRWGLQREHYETDDDFEAGIEQVWQNHLAECTAFDSRVRQVLEPAIDYEIGLDARRRRPCPVCDTEGTATTFTWQMAPGATSLSAACSRGCTTDALGEAVESLVHAHERLEHASAQNEATQAARAASSLTAALAGAKPQRWVVPGVVPADGLTLLSGCSGDGKTWLALWLAICAASGSSWIDARIERTRTLLVLLEGALDDRNRRIRAMTRGMQLDFEELEAWLGIYPHRLALDDPESMAALRTHVRDCGYRFVLIDNLTEARSNRDENSVAVMGAALRPLAEMCRVDKIGGVILHHANARGELRGSSAIKQHPDAVFEISRSSPANNAKVRIRNTKDRYGISLAEISYMLEDRLDPVTGGVLAVVPDRWRSLTEVRLAVELPTELQGDRRLAQILAALPCTSSGLLKIGTGSNTTKIALRRKLEDAGVIEQFDGVWQVKTRIFPIGVPAV